MLDNNNVIPLYHQLKQILREKVESGEWRPNDMIPSEAQLARQYGVSRATTRRAVDDLTREGLFYRQHGKGTFVSPPNIVQGLSRFYSFSRDMENKGLRPRSKVLHLHEGKADPKVRKALRLEEGATVYELRRLRLAGDEPIILETSWLPAELFPGLIAKDLESQRLYDLMEKVYGVRPVNAEEYFEPICVDEYESQMLGVPIGAPALLLHRMTFDEKERPVEVCKSIVRGDKCRYYVRLP
ncbi:MAG: GntR family transcriptional regulator [Firmicutes bacterium]|nr:GntR family transcriptional regulator [Bacillota bacterium]